MLKEVIRHKFLGSFIYLKKDCSRRIKRNVWQFLFQVNSFYSFRSHEAQLRIHLHVKRECFAVNGIQ